MEKVINLRMEQLSENLYQVSSNDLEGLVAQGKTAEEAVQNAKNLAGKLLEAQAPKREVRKINLCSGPVRIEDYTNVDLRPDADIVVDLEKELFPLQDNSVDIVVCVSGINYFTRQRAIEIVRDVHRILKPGGIARFSVQDLRIFAEKYEHCGKYVYDFESLKAVFEEAGFSYIEQKKYRESLILEVDKLDSRGDQSFFLEAVKDKISPSVSKDEINTVLGGIRQRIVASSDSDNLLRQLNDGTLNESEKKN